MSRTFGVAPCVIAGFRQSKGDAVIYMDSDLQDPPELIEKLSVLDEIELLEILEITSVDILNRFEDVVEDNYDKLIKEI